MAITNELLAQRSYRAFYKGASTIVAAVVPKEKRASVISAFADRVDKSVAARTQAREKFASAYRAELAAAGHKVAAAK